MSKPHEEFEKWANRNAHDQLSFADTAMAWDCWQAATAAEKERCARVAEAWAGKAYPKLGGMALSVEQYAEHQLREHAADEIAAAIREGE